MKAANQIVVKGRSEDYLVLRVTTPSTFNSAYCEGRKTDTFVRFKIRPIVLWRLVIL
jgi:hypothetical protein